MFWAALVASPSAVASRVAVGEDLDVDAFPVGVGDGLAVAVVAELPVVVAVACTVDPGTLVAVGSCRPAAIEIGPTGFSVPSNSISMSLYQ